MGGSNQSDIITNLQALCRECHTKFGDQKRFKEMLKDKHRKALEMRQKA
jgi:5-methylcytosine-specific restriction endonuclease McrA